MNMHTKCRLLRRAVMSVMPLWLQWTLTRLALLFLPVRPNTLAVFFVIQCFRIWWSSSMPPCGIPCTVVGVGEEEDGDVDVDVVAMLKNLKIKWLP